MKPKPTRAAPKMSEGLWRDADRLERVTLRTAASGTFSWAVVRPSTSPCYSNTSYLPSTGIPDILCASAVPHGLIISATSTKGLEFACVRAPLVDT